MDVALKTPGRSLAYRNCVFALSVLLSVTVDSAAAADWTGESNTCLVRHNDKEVWNEVIQVAQCQQLCVEETSFLCCSIEHYVNLRGSSDACILSSSTWATPGVKTVSCAGWDSRYLERLIPECLPGRSTQAIASSTTGPLTTNLPNEASTNVEAPSATTNLLSALYVTTTEEDSTAESTITEAAMKVSTAESTITEAAVKDSTAESAITEVVVKDSTTESAITEAVVKDSTAESTITEVAVKDSTAESAIPEAVVKDSTAESAITEVVVKDSTAKSTITEAAVKDSTAESTLATSNPHVADSSTTTQAKTSLDLEASQEKFTPTSFGDSPEGTSAIPMDSTRGPNNDVNQGNTDPTNTRQWVTGQVDAGAKDFCEPCTLGGMCWKKQWDLAFSLINTRGTTGEFGMSHDEKTEEAPGAVYMGMLAIFLVIAVLSLFVFMDFGHLRYHLLHKNGLVERMCQAQNNSESSA